MTKWVYGFGDGRAEGSAADGVGTERGAPVIVTDS